MTSRKTVIAAETRAEIDQLARLTQRQPHRRDFEPAICATGLIGRLISAAEYAGAVRTLQLTARTTAPFSERHEVLMRPTLAAPPALIGALQRGCEWSLNPASVLSRVSRHSAQPGRVVDR